ncbi:MAG: response regulator [Burkholderiaceae bacterium]|nr:response regulator [Burkholderiaceae bacterium]
MIGRACAQAASLTLLACLLQWAVMPQGARFAPFLLLLPAIGFAALWRGRSVALVVLAGSVVSALFWLPAAGEPAAIASRDRLAVLVFVLLGAALAETGTRLRRAVQRAMATEDRLLRALADVDADKAVAAQLEQVRSALGQQVQDLQRLHELSSRLPEIATMEEQVRLILLALAEFHGARRGLLCLFDPAGKALVPVAGLGFSDRAMSQVSELSCTIAARGAVRERRHRLVVEDTELDPRFAGHRALAREEGFRAVHATPLLSQAGDVLGVIAVYFDVARAPTERERTLADICARKAAVFVERARTEAQLRESQIRFRVALEASAVPFAVLMPVRADDGRIVEFTWSYLNGAAAEAMQRPASALVGRAVADWPGEGAQSGAVAQLRAVVELGTSREFEMQAGADGNDGWFHCIASPMRDSVALWFAEITERKKNELKLLQADRRKDEFLATLAHELRNPLAPIRQAAFLSCAPGASETQKRWSHEVIDRQVRHMGMLLDDLLDVSRITRGALSLRRKCIALSTTIRAGVETALPLIETRHQQLSVDLPDEEIWLDADPLRLAQVVANLLTNAAKYSNLDGRICVKAERCGNEVVITVSDEGIGIAPECLPHLFTMFTQLSTGDRQAGGGLGIGLALTRGLVNLHGGSIEVHSAGKGLGSAFTVRLPRGSATREPESVPAGEPRRATTGRSILIADDNRDAAESLAALLQLEGHEVIVAFDGEEALAACQRARPDICLLDLGMPRRSGNEVAHAIRQMSASYQPVLIAVTGWGQERDKSEALGAGFDHHVTKPVDPQLMIRLAESGTLQQEHSGRLT